MKNRICDKNAREDMYLDKIIKKAKIALNRAFSSVYAFSNHIFRCFLVILDAVKSLPITIIYVGCFLALVFSVVHFILEMNNPII